MAAWLAMKNGDYIFIKTMHSYEHGKIYIQAVRYYLPLNSCSTLAPVSIASTCVISQHSAFRAQITFPWPYDSTHFEDNEEFSFYVEMENTFFRNI